MVYELWLLKCFCYLGSGCLDSQGGGVYNPIQQTIFIFHLFGCTWRGDGGGGGPKTKNIFFFPLCGFPWGGGGGGGGGHKTKIKGFLNCLTKWLSRKLSLTVSWLESTLPACLVMRKLIIALGGWSQLLNIGPDLCVCLGYHCNIYFSEGCS